ncbi:acetyl-coenzyme A synthetase [Meredithblackwellia eburnea MCA 4105]
MPPKTTPSARTLFYRPSAAQVEAAGDTLFRKFVNKRHNLLLRDYWELHRWSTDKVEQFWEALWSYGGIIGSFQPGKLFDPSFPMDKPNPNLINARMNFCENMLLSHSNARSNFPAVTAVTEPDPKLSHGTKEYLQSTFSKSYTFAELYNEVHRAAEALRSMGVTPGDRVATYAPSNAEAIVLLLATAAIGGVFSSCPAEFGVKATLDRLTQIEPKVLLTADEYRYNGKSYKIYPNLLEILEALPSVKNVIVVGQLQYCRSPAESLPRSPYGGKWQSWGEFVHQGAVAAKGQSEIDFYRGPAMAPLYVLYSSGTTGKPKAIVHTVGGMVLSSKLCNLLHYNFKAGDSFLQFSTLGWMMFNLATSTLGTGTTMVVYDGSPLKPLSILFDLVDHYQISVIGVSPRYLQTLDTAGYIPNDHHSLKSLVRIATAGSVLKADLYDWIRANLGKSVWINNASGGTDICNLFVGPVPSLAIYHSEMQAPILGMLLESWDDEGKPIIDGQGEMVISRPFPNAPLGFWGDDDGVRYKEAYYEAFSRPVWTQGDWIEVSSITGGVTIFGRSDGVLNPAGVRFGSSELYNVVEELREWVEDSIAVGQKILGGDERVILFVKPKGSKLTSQLQEKIRKAISKNLSPRHIPAKIIHCQKIPYTTNGKKLEVATKKLVNGVPLSKINITSAEDPEALKFFINHPELKIEGPVMKAKL